MESPQARRVRRGRWFPPLATAGAITALLLAPIGTFETESWWPGWADRLFALSAIGLDKVVHASLFAFWAWTLLRSPVRASRHAFGLVVGLAALYGGVLELVQLRIPGRSGDVFDLLADVGGAAIVVLAFERSRSGHVAAGDR
jgi:hypothetical protein